MLTDPSPERVQRELVLAILVLAAVVLVDRMPFGRDQPVGNVMRAGDRAAWEQACALERDRAAEWRAEALACLRESLPEVPACLPCCELGGAAAGEPCLFCCEMLDCKAAWAVP